MTSALSVRHLWKIFGSAEHRILGSPDEGLDRAELRAKTGCTVAVRDVSFEVAPGEAFVVMGLSGSGKSTLVRCLTRLVEPTAGEVRLGGTDVRAASDTQLRELRRRRVAMVFQHFGLLPHRRVLDNVCYGLEIRGVKKAERHERGLRMLSLVGLDGLHDSLPAQLSGGMQQRVGLARALAVEPDLLLFDEPFSALDPLIRRDMQDEVVRLRSEVRTPMVFITHDLSEALRIGDRIAIMRDGALVQVGTPTEIVGSPADDYVRAFTADVVRARVFTAGSVLRPARPGDDLTGPTTGPDTLVADVVGLVAADDRPVRVVDGDRLLGVLDRVDVLTVVAGPPSSPPPPSPPTSSPPTASPPTPDPPTPSPAVGDPVAPPRSVPGADATDATDAPAIDRPVPVQPAAPDAPAPSSTAPGG